MTDIYVTGIQFRGRGHARQRPDPTLPLIEDDRLGVDMSTAAQDRFREKRRVARLAAQAMKDPIPVEPWEPLIWEETLG